MSNGTDSNLERAATSVEVQAELAQCVEGAGKGEKKPLKRFRALHDKIVQLKNSKAKSTLSREFDEAVRDYLGEKIRQDLKRLAKVESIENGPVYTAHVTEIINNFPFFDETVRESIRETIYPLLD